MTWSCKYEISGYCTKLKCDCEPVRPGCELYGKYVRARDLIPEEDQAETKTNDSKKEEPLAE